MQEKFFVSDMSVIVRTSGGLLNDISTRLEIYELCRLEQISNGGKRGQVSLQNKPRKS